MDIAAWRTKIDSIDTELVRLISERAAAAMAIGKLKQASAAPIYEPQREQQVFANVRAANPGPLTPAQMQDIFERVMDVMRALQRPQ